MHATTKKSSPKIKDKVSAQEHKVPSLSAQPAINIGLVGHVDNGKTTLVSTLTSKWTDTHSEEIKRGITIRLGYADATFYKCTKCGTYSTTPTCSCGSQATPTRKISFIDAPGHESLMATMLSGAAIMDAAILLVAANEPCPQPQTKEHLVALQIIGCKNIIIAQNKIDLVTKEDALKNYQQIIAFVKGTIAEHAPIIPISAQHNVNINILIQAIEEYIPTQQRDPTKPPLMYIARSFDVNRPGTEIKKLAGGVLGGSLKQGILNLNQEIEIRPGISVEKEGKRTTKPITTKIAGLKTGTVDLEEAHPGGSIGVQTTLDPFYVKADSLTGNVVGAPGQLPPVWEEFSIAPKLLESVVGSKEELKVDPIKKLEPLMLNVNAAATVGVVTEIKKNQFHVKLKIPVCCSKEDRITISRMIGNRWRLIGYGTIV